MSKKELRLLYGISYMTLHKLLNERYFEELEKVGYVKTDRILPPVVIQKFQELYGKPFTETDY